MNVETGHHAVEAEQQLLGALLTRNEIYYRVSEIISADDFYDPVHQDIWTAATARIRKDHIASPVTLKTILETHPGLQELGGARYLARLAGVGINVKATPEFATLIVELSQKRALQEALSVAMEALPTESTQEVVTGLFHATAALPDVKGQESSFSLMKAAEGALQDAADSRDGKQEFLKTGLPALDRILMGLAPGDLMLLGGTTSMGKTATAIEIATHTALSDEPGGVAFVSLEMSHKELATRMISAQSSVNYSSLRNAAGMDEKEFQRWVGKAQKVAEGAMRIIPKHVRDIPAIHAAVKRCQQEMGVPIKLIVVDYAQLVRGDGRSRYEQMTSVSIGLKTMAGLLGCPVVALVQLSRDIGFRDDRRPMLSDIKETGQFENDADQVVFCNREDYWLQRSGPKLGKDGGISVEARADWEADLADAKNKMELIVRKNRHGRLATAEVGFHAPTNRFWDLKSPPEDMAGPKEMEF